MLTKDYLNVSLRLQSSRPQQASFPFVLKNLVSFSKINVDGMKPQDFHISPISESDLPAVIQLIAHSFQTYIAPSYSAEGITAFQEVITPAAFAERKPTSHLLIAKLNHSATIVGVIELKNFQHILLYFVEPGHLGKGIGKALMQAALETIRQHNPTLKQVTVNSTAFALEVYTRFGFVADKPEQYDRGIRFTPMTFQLER